LPFPDNSVEEIRAHHILEHIGDGFIPLMQELYRVSKHGCLLDIIVPHHQHENFYSDPTHKRPITVGGMYLFCQKSNKESIERGDSNSTLGLKYGINFIVENYSFEYDGFYHGLISSVEEKRKNGKLTQEDDFMYRRLMREATNVAVHTIIKMRAVKE